VFSEFIFKIIYIMSSTRKYKPKLPSIIESDSAENQNENGNIFEGEFYPNNQPKNGKLIYKDGSYFSGSFDKNGNFENGSVFVPFVNEKGKQTVFINPLRTNFKILYGGMGQIRHIPTCLVLRGLKQNIQMA